MADPFGAAVRTTPTARHDGQGASCLVDPAEETVNPVADLTLFNWAGHLGVAFYVGSYAALQAGLIRGAGYLYAFLNLVAASLVLISLYEAFNPSAAIIQAFWIVISIVGITRLFVINYRIRFTEEEQALIDSGLLRMPQLQARRLLDGGVWSVPPPGTLLATEGQPVTEMHVVLHGAAEVIVGERSIATITDGLVGELNVLKAGPASATVRITEPSRVFTISGRNLRALSDRDAEFRAHLHDWLREAMHVKLSGANARLATTADSRQRSDPPRKGP